MTFNGRLGLRRFSGTGSNLPVSFTTRSPSSDRTVEKAGTCDQQRRCLGLQSPFREFPPTHSGLSCLEGTPLRCFSFFLFEEAKRTTVLPWGPLPVKKRHGLRYSDLRYSPRRFRASGAEPSRAERQVVAMTETSVRVKSGMLWGELMRELWEAFRTHREAAGESSAPVEEPSSTGNRGRKPPKKK